MKSTGQLYQRLKLYAYVDQGAQGVAAPTYVLQRTVHGALHAVDARMQYAAAQAGDVIDAMVSVVDDAPLTELGLVADADWPNELYLLSGVRHATNLQRMTARARRVDRGQYPLSDAAVASLVPTPTSVSVPHGTGTAANVCTIQPTDAFGFALAGQYLTVAKSAGTSSVTASLVGYVLSLANIPGAAGNYGDTFTVMCPNVAPIVLPVTFT